MSPPVITGRSIMVMVSLQAATVAALSVPNGGPRFHLGLNVAGRLLAIDLSTSGVRWAQEVIREHGPEGVACIVQGKLVGERIEEASIVAIPKRC
jgi:hypothetical protein